MVRFCLQLSSSADAETSAANRNLHIKLIWDQIDITATRSCFGSNWDYIICGNSYSHVYNLLHLLFQSLSVLLLSSNTHAPPQSLCAKFPLSVHTHITCYVFLLFYIYLHTYDLDDLYLYFSLSFLTFHTKLHIFSISVGPTAILSLSLFFSFSLLAYPRISICLPFSPCITSREYQSDTFSALAYFYTTATLLLYPHANINFLQFL